MTFSLPEIKLDSHRVYAILKIVVIVSVFMVVAVNVFLASAAAANAYEFVYCKNPITGLTIIYPTGTECSHSNESEDDEEDDNEDE